MLVLGINTAGDACEAALARDGALVALMSEPMTQGHDARLAPLVDQLMREYATAFRELDRVAVVVGPGSFTGVRVGVAFARSLALGADARAVGVSSLEALAPAPTGRVLALLPARRRPPDRTWWAQLLVEGRGAGDPVEVGPDDIIPLAATAEAVVGDLEGVPELGRPRRQAGVSAAAAALWAARVPPDDLPPPRPIYVRAPDAAPMRPALT